MRGHSLPFQRIILDGLPPETSWWQGADRVQFKHKYEARLRYWVNYILLKL